MNGDELPSRIATLATPVAGRALDVELGRRLDGEHSPQSATCRARDAACASGTRRRPPCPP